MREPTTARVHRHATVRTRSGSTSRRDLHPDRFTSEIVASAYDEGTVYVTQNGRRNDDFARIRVALHRPTGRPWESLSGERAVRAGEHPAREDRENENLLYLGTDVGVYVSLDRGGDVAPAVPRHPEHLRARPRRPSEGRHHGRGDARAWDVRLRRPPAPAAHAGGSSPARGTCFAAEDAMVPGNGVRGGFGFTRSAQRMGPLLVGARTPRSRSRSWTSMEGWWGDPRGTRVEAGLHAVEWSPYFAGSTQVVVEGFRRPTFVLPGTVHGRRHDRRAGRDTRRRSACRAASAFGGMRQHSGDGVGLERVLAGEARHLRDAGELGVGRHTLPP